MTSLLFGCKMESARQHLLCISNLLVVKLYAHKDDTERLQKRKPVCIPLGFKAATQPFWTIFTVGVAKIVPRILETISASLVLADGDGQQPYVNCASLSATLGILRAADKNTAERRSTTKNTQEHKLVYRFFAH